MIKAFDTINREHLYRLLSDILDPDELNIINILLKDVTLQVKINITKGQTFTTTLGIPQGDCLSAIPFTLYLSNTLFFLLFFFVVDIIMSTYKLRCSIVGHSSDVRAVTPAFRPNGGIISASRDRTAVVWNPNK